MLSQVLNLNLLAENWLQAIIPIRYRGPSIHLFLASAAGTARIQNSIFANTTIPEDAHLSAAKIHWSKWSSECNVTNHRQKSLYAIGLGPSIGRERFSLFKINDHVRLNAITMPHSGDWLLSFPTTALGLRLDDKVVRIVTGLCTWCPLKH